MNFGQDRQLVFVVRKLEFHRVHREAVMHDHDQSIFSIYCHFYQHKRVPKANQYNQSKILFDSARAILQNFELKFQLEYAKNLLSKII